MKLKCEILGVEATGTSLRLKLQGKRQADADWRDWNGLTIEIPALAGTARTFYVGRTVTVEIKP